MITRLLLCIFFLSAPPVFAQSFNVLNYGATANDGTDDVAAFRAAQAAWAAYSAGSKKGEVFIPCGVYYLSSRTDVGNEGLQVRGESSHCVHLMLSQPAVAAFRVHNTNIMQGANFSGITCIDAYQTSSGACLELVGNENTSRIQYSTFRDIRCFGVSACIINARGTNNGGESMFDWNLFTDIQTGNYGGAPTHYGILTVNGSGTGNVFTNMNLVADWAGLYWGGGWANVGDITISNIQTSAGALGGVYLGPNAAYKARVTITNMQCDAGATVCVNASGYDRLSLIGVTLGGGVVNSLPGRTNFYCGSLVC